MDTRLALQPLFVTALAVVAAPAAASPVAEATLSLEATPRQAEPGSLIEVSTKIATDNQIAAFQFTVEYDDHILSFVDATLGADLVGGFAVTNVVEDPLPPTEPGTNRSVLVQVIGSGVSWFTGPDNEVARLRFRLTVNEGTSPLVFNSSICQVTHMSTIDLLTLCPDDLAFQGDEVTSGSGSPPPPPGDPQASIVWRNADKGKASLWLMDGTTVLAQSGGLAPMDHNWTMAATGDFNGDGHTDLLWRHRVDGRNLLWLMDETALLPGSGLLPTLRNRRWVVAATADFNGDGNTDVLWRHTAKGKNSLWLMDGTTVLPGSGPLPALPDLDWIVAAAGDFDGDGSADVLWRHLGDGRNSMWLLDGTTILPGSGALPVVDEAGWVIAGAADFDGDGYADVLWRDLATGDNLICFMDGTLGMPFADWTSSVGRAWTVVGTGD